MLNKSTIKKAIVGIATVIAATGLGSAAVSAHNGGNAVPSNNYGHWWTTDGCSWVPDSGVAVGGGWFDFNHACIHHDGCYRHHWASKATCDQWFLNDMRASCKAIYPNWWSDPWRKSCEGQADLYFRGVQRFGQPAYVAWSHQVRMA